ncbi:MAG: N-acetylmuramoyl-L-alanine amidase [Candidatus Wallbacteria bacterium]|nr:N-acetylmuramoyl-L-alanine amidase [Candidatus Wallbacteria bacterium]
MVGPGGTREADMNLAVARQLATMLSAEGARVLMTRTADGDLLAQPAPLKDELRARAVLAERAAADLFVSLHHNATPDVSSPRDLLARNRSEAYFKMEDPASGELGARLLSALKPLTHSSRNQLFPSNFAVLRNNARPATLGEPFYLSIDLFERYGSDPRFPGVEAALYQRAVDAFLGEGGRPQLRLTAPYPGEVLTGRDLVVAGERLPAHRQEGRTTPARDAKLLFRLDGKAAEPSVDWLSPLRFVARFPRISSGPHELRVFAADSRDRWSAAESRSMVVSSPAAAIGLEVLPPTGDAPGVPRIVRVRVSDRYGRLVADGRSVTATWRSSVLSRSTTAGYAAFALDDREFSELRLSAGAAVTSVEPRVDSGPAPGRWIWVHVRDADTGRPVVALSVDGAGRSAYSTEDGLLVAEARAGSRVARAPGYVPARFEVRSGPIELSLVSVLGGSLRGRAVSVDASACGSGTALLDSLDAALGAAGCRAERRIEPELTDRVRASNARSDDLYLCLRSAKGSSSTAQYYAASAKGKALAAALAAQLPPGARGVESGEYVLSNTSGTALVVNLCPADLASPASTAVAFARGLAAGLTAAGSVKVQSNVSGGALPLAAGIVLLSNGTLGVAGSSEVAIAKAAETSR